MCLTPQLPIQMKKISIYGSMCLLIVITGLEILLLWLKLSSILLLIAITCYITGTFFHLFQKVMLIDKTRNRLITASVFFIINIPSYTQVLLVSPNQSASILEADNEKTELTDQTEVNSSTTVLKSSSLVVRITETSILIVGSVLLFLFGLMLADYLGQDWHEKTGN